MKSLILVKDIGRSAKPEGDTGIWGGHPKVPAETSFMPWTSSLSSSLIPKRQLLIIKRELLIIKRQLLTIKRELLIIKVFPLGPISSFCSLRASPEDGKVLGSPEPRGGDPGDQHTLRASLPCPAVPSHLQRNKPGAFSLSWETMKFCVQRNLWRKPELSTRRASRGGIKILLY